ncbi:MAG: hypothetical protein H6573_17570 [Lewinellaceae bacterium]|nr:hypothetical protein [Phaeodactylibacter sp.]MCB9349299.1 hypothetical protein [Lewinellaceae bacterium]
MNDTEYNRHTLKEALGRLPLYQPPDNLWGKIEAELEREDKELALNDALAQLPSYSPPPSVWEAVEAGLEKEQERQAPRFRLRRLIWPAAAACIAAMVAWFVFYPSEDAGLQAVYTYEIEKTTTGLFENDWDEDEDALKTVVEQFSRDPLAKRQDQYNDILEDWRELQEAKAEIREMMDRYGKDARLVRQMGEIERERSKLARAMATAI